METSIKCSRCNDTGLEPIGYYTEEDHVLLELRNIEAPCRDCGGETMTNDLCDQCSGDGIDPNQPELTIETKDFGPRACGRCLGTGKIMYHDDKDLP